MWGNGAWYCELVLAPAAVPRDEMHEVFQWIHTTLNESSYLESLCDPEMTWAGDNKVQCTLDH